MNLAHQRLVAQHLVGSPFDQLAAAVRWFGAVQAQDYSAAAWAIGQRAVASTAAMVNEALARGDILRTHILRPTWHFVLPEDIRWMLALTAPRIKRAVASYGRQWGADAAIIGRAESVIAAALQGGRQRTKAELSSVLKQSGISFANAFGYGHVILHAELDGLICSGGLRGKQQTYALLDERVPPGPTLARDEALAELARRYFTSHGPATVADFAWWSGLTMADARHGLDAVRQELDQQVVDRQIYWSAASPGPAKLSSPVIHFLPNYDEYLVAYKDRQAAVDPVLTAKVGHWTGNVLFSHTIVRDGQVIGTWQRTSKGDAVEIVPNLFTELSDGERAALTRAADHYGAFLGQLVTVAR